MPRMQFRRRTLAMVSEGVPRGALEALGLDLGASQSYGELLRALPEEVGIQLEFWRSVPGAPRAAPLLLLPLPLPRGDASVQGWPLLTAAAHGVDSLGRGLQGLGWDAPTYLEAS